MTSGAAWCPVTQGLYSKEVRVNQKTRCLGIKKNPSVGVELRAGGDPNKSEKMGGVPVTQGSGLKKKMPKPPVSPKGFCSCSKSAK